MHEGRLSLSSGPHHNIFGGVVAMKKGGKKYIIYVVSNSYVNSNFYLKVVCKHHTCTGLFLTKPEIKYPVLRAFDAEVEGIL